MKYAIEPTYRTSDSTVTHNPVKEQEDYSIIIIIIKTQQQRPKWEQQIVYKFLMQPHKHLRHGKTEKQIQGSDQRLTAPLNPSNVPVSNTV